MLAVIVVSYNTRPLLLECLDSVFRGLDRFSIPAEVWVVDNASSDGSAEAVRAHFPQTHLLQNIANVGFAAANNRALHDMGFPTNGGPLPDAVLLLNPDTVILDDALPQMYSALASRPNVGVVGAALVYPDGRFQHSAFRFPDLLQVFFDFFPLNHRLIDSRLNGRYPQSLYTAGRPFRVDHPLGAAFMVKRATIEQVGLLDERFFMYCEEIDWCLRIRQAGWEILCVPQAKMIHHAGGSTRQFRSQMFVALWRSRLQLFEKHYSPLFRRAVRLLLIFALRHEIREIKGRATRNEVSPDELSHCLQAYHRVLEMVSQWTR